MQLGKFQRAIGLVILGAAAGAAALLWSAVSAGRPAPTRAPSEGVVFGVWRVLYDTQAPAPRVLMAAAALAILFAAGIAVLERRITNRSRRSANHRATPLAPKVVMAATEGDFAGPVTVTVLIPAHNEATTLGHTIASLLSQSHRPERVIVVADNCTDATVAVARRAGVEVVESVANTKKKAGALNQALRRLLPQQGDNDVVMVMDADTTLDAGFLEAAVARFTSDRALMAVGGLFSGRRARGCSASSSATSTSGTPARCVVAAVACSCSPAPPRSSGRSPCAPSRSVAAGRSPARTATSTTPPP